MEYNFPTTLPDFRLTKTHIKLLKHAKRRIRNCENEHICNALSNGTTNPAAKLKCSYLEAVNAMEDLKRFIRRAIQSRIYFDTWQRANGIRRTDEKVRGDRVRWIKYILENAEYQDSGE